MAHLELPIAGMTCASCANRIERNLNKLDGVSASVNYATETASVEFDAAVEPEALLAAVEAAGYQAVLPVRRAGGGRGDRRDGAAAAAPARLARADAPGARDGDDPAAAVRQLAVAVADARRAGRRVGRVAVPPRRLGQPQARGGDDGHADLARRARRLRVVALRAVHRRRRHARHDDELRPRAGARRGRRRDLPRGRHRGDGVHARRPLLRGARQAPRRRRAEGAARAGRQGRRAARRRRASRSSSSPSATASSCGRARRWPPTASSRRAPAPSTSRC